MAGTVYSSVSVITNITKLSYDISWVGGSGATAGTFQVQVSNTYKQNSAGVVQVTGNWNTLTLSSTPTVAAASGNGFIEIDVMPAYAVRLVYLPTGGSGTLNAAVAGKIS